MYWGVEGKKQNLVWDIFPLEGHCSEQSWVTVKESKSSCWGWAWTGQMQSWGGPISAKALRPLPNANIATLAPPENFNHLSCIISLCFWSKHFLRTNSDSRWEQSQISFGVIRKHLSVSIMTSWKNISYNDVMESGIKKPWNGTPKWKVIFLYSFWQGTDLAWLFSGCVWSLMLFCIVSET